MDIEVLLESFDGAFAPNTLRAYRADFAQFALWCAERRQDPWQIGGESLAAFVDDMAQLKSPATVRRYIASIGSLYRLGGLQPVTGAPEVVLALKRMHRRLGRAQAQAVPLTRAVLETLLRACTDDRRGLADQVMLRLGYETMRRRAELCHFRFDDLEQLPSGKAGIRMRFSKTDQLGVGKLIPVSPTLRDLLLVWGNEVGARGYVLRSLSRPLDPESPLAPSQINLRLRHLQAAAGLELGGWLSGHSFRVGAALDLLEIGMSIEKIMLRGGWRAESTVIRYLRAWEFE